MLKAGLTLTLLGTLAFVLHCGGGDVSADPQSSKDAAANDSTDAATARDDAGNATTPAADAASDAASSSSGGAGSDGGGSGFTDYSVKGPHQTAHESSSTGNAACDKDVVRYHPTTAGSAVATVLMQHGFGGNVGDLEGVAEHLASWGFDVLAVTACTFSDHAKNGAALSALADRLEIPAPYFGGFSAGGLAGFLAAKQNARSAGYVGLDPVDANDLAKDAAPLTVPVRAVLTEPSQCNSSSNFVAVLSKQATGKAVRVVGASHYDSLGSSCAGLNLTCSAFCSPTGAGRHETSLAFTTAALLELSGDAAAGGYFTPGSAAYEAHLVGGSIEAL